MCVDHIYPGDDPEPHVLCRHCWCRPFVLERYDCAAADDGRGIVLQHRRSKQLRQLMKQQDKNSTPKARNPSGNVSDVAQVNPHEGHS